MKQKIIIISVLLFAILSRTKGQNQFSDYVSYLKDKETVIGIEDPKRIQRFEWHLFPKPMAVKKYTKKVVVVFDRKEWDRVQYLQRREWLKKRGMNKTINNIK